MTHLSPCYRVSAYCRVSTDSQDQLNSLENQKKFFTDYISNNDQWQLVQIYADEGKTGTSTKNRKAFNKMIQDAELGLFDMILTKEISRFARNTLDSIYYTRKLKESGIGVFFLSDNINTLDADSELRLTIMSSIAQEESRKTSERVKWGQKRRMEQGVVFGNSILGYDLQNGKLDINPTEATIVKLIFQKYLNESKGVTTISKELENDGYLTKTLSKKWHAASLYKILKNEKYVGDLLQRKSYTPNYLTHQSRHNKGEEEFVYLKDNHPPIIDRETFDATKAEIKRRSVNLKEKSYRQSNRYPFSGKIECGICGHKFVGRRRIRKNGIIKKTWQCGQNAKYGCLKENGQGELVGCENGMIPDEVIQKLFLQSLDKIIIDKEKIKMDLKKIIIKVLSQDQNQTQLKNLKEKLALEVERITNKKHQLIDLYFENTVSKDDLKQMTEKYDKELHLLNTKLNQEKNRKIIENSNFDLLNKINQTIDDLVSMNTFGDEICKLLLDHVIVHSKNNIEIFIKGSPNNSNENFISNETHKSNDNIPSNFALQSMYLPRPTYTTNYLQEL